MALSLSSVSSEEFSFPSLASSHHSGLDSPPLWKHSPVNSSLRKDYDFGFPRLLIGKEGDHYHDQAKSFSHVEMRRRWSEDNRAEDKMDMLWEDLNEDLPPRSQSLRIVSGEDGGGEKTTSFFSDESSAVVAVGCGTGMKLSKNTPKKNKKRKNLNVLVLMRVLKKLIVLRSSSHRSPVKTHPR